MIIAFDSETQDGYAILLTKPWSFAEPSSFEDCIDFLERDRELACWNADYDVQAVVKWLPRECQERLGVLNECTYKDFRIRYIPHKFCRIWRRHPLNDNWRLLVTIYDMRQFYNCSLKTAAAKLGVPPKDEIPASWYQNMRARLKDPRTRAKVLRYAMQDAQTLQAIINRTVDSFALAGMSFDHPFSNASFAERYFRDRFRYRRNYEVERFAEAAYHGGRIECLMTGYFRRAWHYDIHSAYPDVIAKLVKPDGEWIYEESPTEIRPDAVYAYIDCQCNIPHSVRVGPIPYRRRNGGIFYPVGSFRKTVTLGEYQYLQGRGWVGKIYRAWVHYWPSWTFPFGEIADLYRKRKADKRVDYALKIVMNSVYGKLAQVIETWIRTNRVDSNSEIFDDRVWSRKRTWKGHTSFVYASEITARTRLRLLNDIPPEVVICYATDGVFTTCEVPIKTGGDIGEWSDVEEVRDLIVVGSGVYSYFPFNGKGKEKRPIVRFRGFNPQIDLPGMLRKAGNRHYLPMRVLRNTSLKLSTKGPKWKDRMNVLEEHKRYLDVNFDHKRKWPKQWGARDLTRKRFDSKPLIYWGKIRIRR
jgi:DNA polymerase family B